MIIWSILNPLVSLFDMCRFNWGLSVRNLSARIVNLLENELFLKEERARTRKLTRGIQGFGSFTSRRSPSHDGSFKGLNFRPCRRCNSDNSAQINQEYEFLAPDDNLLTDKRIHKAEKIYEDVSSGLENSGEIREDEYPVEDHPFCYSDHHTSESLLSTLKWKIFLKFSFRFSLVYIHLYFRLTVRRCKREPSSFSLQN